MSRTSICSHPFWNWEGPKWHLSCPGGDYAFGTWELKPVSYKGTRGCAISSFPRVYKGWRNLVLILTAQVPLARKGDKCPAWDNRWTRHVSLWTEKTLAQDSTADGSWKLHREWETWLSVDGSLSVYFNCWKWILTGSGMICSLVTLSVGREWLSWPWGHQHCSELPPDFLPRVLTGAALLIQMGKLGLGGVKPDVKGEGWEGHRGLGSLGPPFKTT